MLRPGSMLGGRFRVHRVLALGSASLVVADEVQSLQRVWLLALDLAVDPAVFASACEREARFALGVPGLARATCSGVDGRLAFVGFRAPLAESVAGLLTVAWRLPRVAALAERVAQSLGPLHDQGIAHGWIRSELVVEGEASVLYGFGVAALMTRFGVAGAASRLLEPRARAPELGAARAPTPASDVFALAQLLRGLLLRGELADSTSPNPLGPEVEALFVRALADDPRERLFDVRAFATELTRLSTLADCRAASRSAAGVTDSPSMSPLAELPLAELPLAELPPAELPPAESPRIERASVAGVRGESSEGLATSPLPTPHATEMPPLADPAARFLPARRPGPDGRPSNAVAWLALLAVCLGFVVLFGAVVGGLVYANRHGRALARRGAPAAPALTSVPSFRRVPTPSLDEPRTASGPSDSSPVPNMPSHVVPLVNPGFGPSAFPEEARAALPVLGSEPIWGTRSASLTWVLFGDLECPHTRRLWRSLEAMKALFGDELRIVFRHRPLPEHPNALRAARVLAGLQRTHGSVAFFRVLDRISRDEEVLSDERLLADMNAAGYPGLDVAALARAGESAVTTDLVLAGQFAVRSTPFSFLNGLRIEGERTPEELKKALLAERRAASWILASGTQANDLYVARVNSNLIGVGEQPAARVCVPITGSPARGPLDALVTLVEFSDFACANCKQVEPTLKLLLTRYPQTLRLIWKDFPLPQHRQARLLANFAAEAGSRGAARDFWRIHDGILSREGDPDETALGELAGQAGLSGALLLNAARTLAHDGSIRADITLGKRLGVNGTPTFFANGRRIEGALALAPFDAIIREELAVAQRIVSGGVPKDKLYGLACGGDSN